MFRLLASAIALSSQSYLLPVADACAPRCPTRQLRSARVPSLRFPGIHFHSRQEWLHSTYAGCEEGTAQNRVGFTQVDQQEHVGFSDEPGSQPSAQQNVRFPVE